MNKPLPHAFTIAIVEDDPWYGQLLQYYLSLDPDHCVKLYTSGQEFLQTMAVLPDVVTIDYSLPDMSGDQLLDKLQTRFPGVPVIVISAQDRRAGAVELLRRGAADYLVKDEFTKDLLANTMSKIRENVRLRQQVHQLEQELHDWHACGAARTGAAPARMKMGGAR